MNDYDEIITGGLRQRRASGAFRQELAQQSGQALARHYGRRVWLRRMLTGCATMMLVLAAYQMGRSTTRHLAQSESERNQHPGRRTDSVRVPTDLVTWLEAGRFFRQLGMEERAKKAFDQAGKLAPLGEFERTYSESDHRRATIASLLTRSDHLALGQQKTQGNQLRRRRNFNTILAQSNGELGHDW